MTQNTQVLLAKRPHGEPTDDCFKYVTVETPALEENQVLIKVVWLSLDPYMRGRMNDMKSYAASLEVGETTIVANADDPRLMPVDLDNGTLSAHIGVVGMPGRTAYFGLTDVGKPVAGETLVVAAASGAVGSVVGQIAKSKKGFSN